jgi:hypothetical protein
VTGSREHGNEHSGLIKAWNFLTCYVTVSFSTRIEPYGSNYYRYNYQNFKQFNLSYYFAKSLVYLRENNIMYEIHYSYYSPIYIIASSESSLTKRFRTPELVCISWFLLLWRMPQAFSLFRIITVKYQLGLCSGLYSCESSSLLPPDIHFCTFPSLVPISVWYRPGFSTHKRQLIESVFWRRLVVAKFS